MVILLVLSVEALYPLAHTHLLDVQYLFPSPPSGHWSSIEHDESIVVTAEINHHSLQYRLSADFR